VTALRRRSRPGGETFHEGEGDRNDARARAFLHGPGPSDEASARRKSEGIHAGSAAEPDPLQVSEGDVRPALLAEEVRRKLRSPPPACRRFPRYRRATENGDPTRGPDRKLLRPSDLVRSLPGAGRKARGPSERHRLGPFPPRTLPSHD